MHYPTDSSLLQDGVRVLTRTMQRASAALGDPRGRIRNRLRSVGRRVLIIGRQARSRRDAGRAGPQLSAADGHDARRRPRRDDDGAPHQPAAPHRVAVGRDDA